MITVQANSLLSSPTKPAIASLAYTGIKMNDEILRTNGNRLNPITKKIVKKPKGKYTYVKGRDRSRDKLLGECSGGVKLATNPWPNSSRGIKNTRTAGPSNSSAFAVPFLSPYSLITKKAIIGSQ